MMQRMKCSSSPYSPTPQTSSTGIWCSQKNCNTSNSGGQRPPPSARPQPSAHYLYTSRWKTSKVVISGKVTSEKLFQLEVVPTTVRLSTRKV